MVYEIFTSYIGELLIAIVGVAGTHIDFYMLGINGVLNILQNNKRLVY